MKISKLHIDQLRHLENLTFDFTYPEDFYDESKRGKPLDKICLIGQSATGKTSLLELVLEVITQLKGLSIITDKQQFVNMNRNSLIKKIMLKVVQFDNEITLYDNKLEINNIFFSELKSYSGGVNYCFADEKLFYLKSNIISNNNLEIFRKNPLDLYESSDYTSIVNNTFQDLRTIKVFDDDLDPKSWLVLLISILEYKKKFNQKTSELIYKGLLSKLPELSSEFEKWQKENPNILQFFAIKFNPILEKLNLEVDLINTEYTLPIKNKTTDEVIPVQSTSTGTKQLLLTSLPLYQLDTKDAIILIDEPERSLYPDIQMEIMEHYQNLAPEAQFIVATHSPFIAASFEPEERFILYFDEKGKVAVRRGSSPIGDDPNDMLYNDFGIDYINKYGKKIYNEYLEKRRQLVFEKDEKIKDKLQSDIEKIADKYNY